MKIRNTINDFEPIKVGKKGILFELLTTRLEEVLKEDDLIKVFPDKYVENFDGFKRQIDVFIESTINGHKIGIGVECKDYKDPVDVEKIESFKCKCERIPIINKLVFVSRSGYTKGAKKAAELYGIELNNIEKIDESHIFDWVKPFNFFLQKRFIKIDKIVFILLNGTRQQLSKFNNDTIRFDDYGNEVEINKFCTSYLINLSNNEWLELFSEKNRENSNQFGLHLFPKTKLLWSSKKDAEVEVHSFQFIGSIYEELIELKKSGTKEYREITSRSSKAEFIQLTGEYENQKAEVEIIKPKNKPIFQLNYQLIEGKKIICQEKDMIFVKDILK